MNIGSGNFQPMSQEAASPVLSGIQRGLETHLKRLQNQKLQAQLPYAGPEEAAKLKHMDLGNQGDEAVLPYKGPQAAASLQQSQLKNTLQQIINHYMPQQQEAQIAQKGALTNYYNNGGPGGGVGGKQQIQLRHQIRFEHPDWSPQKIDDAASQYQNGSPTFSDGSALPPPSGTIKNLVDQITLKGNTATGNNQARFAATLDQAFKNADSHTRGAFKFAGLAGKLKGGVKAAAASVGDDDPDYQDYLEFTQQDLPAIATELLRTGGASSTDKQKLMALKQANPISLSSNPKLAMQQWKYLESLYGNLSKVISSSPTQIKASLQSGKSIIPNDSESATSGAPKVGTVVKGYTYIGGPPGDKNSWSKN